VSKTHELISLRIVADYERFKFCDLDIKLLQHPAQRFISPTIITKPLILPILI